VEAKKEKEGRSYSNYRRKRYYSWENQSDVHAAKGGVRSLRKGKSNFKVEIAEDS